MAFYLFDKYNEWTHGAKSRPLPSGVSTLDIPIRRNKKPVTNPLSDVRAIHQLPADINIPELTPIRYCSFLKIFFEK